MCQTRLENNVACLLALRCHPHERTPLTPLRGRTPSRHTFFVRIVVSVLAFEETEEDEPEVAVRAHRKRPRQTALSLPSSLRMILLMRAYMPPPTPTMAMPTRRAIDHAGMAEPPGTRTEKMSHPAGFVNLTSWDVLTVVLAGDGLPTAEHLPPGVHVLDQQAEHHCEHEAPRLRLYSRDHGYGSAARSRQNDTEKQSWLRDGARSVRTASLRYGLPAPIM